MNALQPPSLFGTVLDALEVLDRELPPDVEDASVSAELKAIATTHNGHDTVRQPRPDYRKAAARIGYVFACAGAHAAFMQEGLAAAARLLPVASTPRPLYVVSVGSGPGADLLGYFAHLVEHGHRFSSIHCFRGDPEPGWVRPAELLLEGHGAHLPVTLSHLHLDIADPATYRPSTGLFTADLFLSSFLLSKLVARREETDVFFIELGRHALAGSIYVVLDTDSEYLNYHYDQMMQRAGFVRELWLQRTMSLEDGKELLDGFADRYQRDTQLGGRIYFGVYRKA